MGKHAGEEFAAEKLKHPGALLVQILPSLRIAAADHLILAPVYLKEIDQKRIDLRKYLENEVAKMQDASSPDGAKLLVQAGADRVRGTKDDVTACDFGCPNLYAKYMIYASLLAPRYDAGGNELPPAWDKLSDKFKGDLDQFLPSFVQVIDNVSTRLSGGLTTSSAGLDLTQEEIQELFAPMTDWFEMVTTIDSQTLSEAISPTWLLELEQLFQKVGINISISAIVEALLDPILEPIREAIKAYVIDLAKEFIVQLVDAYKVKLELVIDEYTTRLENATPDGVSGTALDFFYQTGLYGHAFNLTAAALANHAVVLPIGDDPVGVGPASFDCSHTLAWMQAGVCDYLSKVLFPLGIDVAGSLSMLRDGQELRAHVGDNSPIECHDGSLSEFTSDPTVQSCELTRLDALMGTKLGTVSRAIPPELSAHTVECSGVLVDGLPGPSSSGGSGDGETADDGGCGCRTAGKPQLTLGAAWIFALLFGASLLRRRRRTTPAAAGAVAAAIVTAGCTANPSGAGGDGEGQSSSHESGPTSSSASDTGGGSSDADELIAALGKSEWNALQTRDGKERAIEYHFDAGRKLWAEVRNPYGPARKSETRKFVVDPDGRTVTTVLVDPDTGDADTWTLEVQDGSPRTLRVEQGDDVEFFEEGRWPEPSRGLTAEVRVFAAEGAVADAFCTSRFNPFDWPTIFDYARGKSDEPVLDTDRVAGAPLLTWHDVGDQFAVSDVDGFDFGTLGGSLLSDQNNFFVWYRGTLHHPGGTIQMREADDSVDDGIIALLGSDVGTSDPYAHMFFVHGFLSNDDEVETWNLKAGDIPIEIIMIRCNADFTDVDVQMSLAGRPFFLIGDQPTSPLITEELFPPPL
jgi:MYXO-CTERM domain-containing protein